MPPLKKDIESILSKRSYKEILDLPADRSRIMNRLVSMTYDKKKVSAWRAMEAIGILSAEIASTDPEFVRNLAGRLLWMIRDESGGIGWSAPEILGEIVRNNPELCADIAPVIASFHEELMLEAGVMRALSRIGRLNDETAGYAMPIIRNALSSENPDVRGSAVMAFAAMSDEKWDKLLDPLLDDDTVIDVYDNGELVQKRIGDMTASIKAGRT
jgi:HEAT repeat protein